MSDPVFMSPEHVAIMNERLETNSDVRAACASLPMSATMGYCLLDGPDGTPVHWTVSFTDTMRFGLVEQPCELLFTGDWRTMIESCRAAALGQVADPGLVPSGDESLIDPLQSILAVAQAAAVTVTFPDL